MPPPTQSDIRDNLGRLSSLSPAVQAILPRLSDDDFELDELSQMVGRDPVLAARVLRVANSPFYGLPRQVGSLREAVLILGFGNLRGLVLSTGLIGAFSNTEATSRSLSTGAAAGALARAFRRDAGQAFTAGLLHNLGELLLDRFAPVYWRELSSETSEAVAARLAHERRIFGYDQCELGSGLAGHWRFPDTIQSAIHHYPQPPDEHSEALTDLVHVAWVIGAAGRPGGGPAFAPEIVRRLDLESEAGRAALSQARQAAKRGHDALAAH